jgi:MFS family permease
VQAHDGTTNHATSRRNSVAPNARRPHTVACRSRPRRYSDLYDHGRPRRRVIRAIGLSLVPLPQPHLTGTISGRRRVPARPVHPSFHDPRFTFLLVGQSVNWVGSWAAGIVLWGFAAYHFSASPEAISFTVLCWSGPPAVLTVLTGGLTDRFGPRVMLIVGYLCSAATSLGMAAAGSLLLLDVMAAACGAARSLCGPASSALPTRVVESDDLLAANSLLGVTRSIGQVAGPLVASVLMATTGFRIAFVADAVTYLVGVLVMFPLPVLPLPVLTREPHDPREAGAAGAGRSAYVRLRRTTAGAAAVARDPGLRRVAVARMGVIFTSGAFLVVEPLYARHVLARPPSQFALFEAAIGIGAIVTGLALPVIRRRLPASGSAVRLMAAGAISYGMAAALFTGTPWVPVAYLGAFAWGAGGTVFYTVAATALQRLAPAGTLGRVAGVISTAESATETVSMPAAGALVAVAGLRPGALVLAAVAVTAGAGCLFA